MNFYKITAIVGALVAMVFAFANLGMYLIGGSDPNWAIFLLLMFAVLSELGFVDVVSIDDCRSNGSPATHRSQR